MKQFFDCIKIRRLSSTAFVVLLNPLVNFFTFKLRSKACKAALLDSLNTLLEVMK